ncbi:MAG: single-stranded-DNA-specific exonuclease RecJ [Bacteroidales bacterium]|nr:single-stranded-DNA-specific exonuclease RecJ [Bacteroidales bacterium]
MEKRWVLKQYGDKDLVDNLAQDIQVDKTCSRPEEFEAYKIIANLLIQRGINNYSDAKKFFRPNIKDLHDPFLLNDMDEAIERIMFAIKGGEKILVYGDYDVDGTSAVALVYSYLELFYSEVDFYIPDRYNEGYGISYQAIDWAYENGFKLIICLDCGIKAIDQIAYSSEKGIDFIIADHHLPGEELPKACAILNPKREDSTYPYKELSGCGIGFKLIQALNIKRRQPFEKLIPYLDLVVIAIAADIVPITGENRILAFYGLKVINHQPRPGLEAILNYSKVVHISDNTSNKLYFNKELNISDLVFLICPRINAAGRIESGKNSVELLISKKLEQAEHIAKKINDNNDRRKELDNHATDQAIEMLQNSIDLKSSKATVVFKDDWNKGVIGIVASRLIEKSYRPTIVFTKSNELITGSARSIKDFDIYSAIESCSHRLEHFGGHKFAAGLSLKEENLEEFIRLFKRKVEENISEAQSLPEIEIDSLLNLNTITPKLYRILKQFAPFGPENNIPIFQSNKLVDTGNARPVGQKHLKLSVIHLDIRHLPFSCIGFGLSNYYEEIRHGEAFDIAFNIDENEWNGKTSLQLNIKDIKLNNK